MTQSSIDILMITYNRPRYTQLSLQRLLATCDASMRVWVWQNGMHTETLGVVKSMLNHPRMHEFHHSLQNRGLREPTNWFWRNAGGDLLGKVDDDCMVPLGWAELLRRAHTDVPKLGVIGCWHFLPEDYIASAARKKIRTCGRGHQLLRNSGVSGSAYLMKRECVEMLGPLKDRQPFPEYCVWLRWLGWINGWYYPFIYVDHMDDPRSLNTQLKSDEELRKHLPLTAKRNGVNTLEDWLDLIRKTAAHVQTSRVEPGRLFLLRSLPYRLLWKMRKFAKPLRYNCRSCLENLT